MSNLQRQAIDEWLKCRYSVKYFIYTYCYTIDTRKETDKIFLMKSWPHLLNLIDELNNSLKNSKNIIIEKSRDMGISWTIMAWELHKVLFSEGFMALNISRREAEVEDPGKTPRSLFGRLDFMYKRLPTYLKMRVDNPFLSFKIRANNSYIVGESANMNAGRDTQYSFILIDEAGMIPILDEMWKSVSNSSNCICLNSTPPREGRNHKFGQLRFAENSGFKILRYHWKEHPEKNALWYAKKTQGMTDDDIARELDINWEKSMIFKIYPEFDDSIHIAAYDIPYNPKKPLYMSFDFGLDDPESILFYQKDIDADNNPRLLVINEYERGGLLTSEHYINIQKKLVEIGYTGSTQAIICYGDPAGKQKERTSRKSVIQEYDALGFIINVKNSETGYPTFEERRRPVKLLFKLRDSLGQPRILISPKCDNFIDSLRQHQRTKIESEEPKKDKSCHSVTSFEFFCMAEFPAITPAAIIYGKDPESVKREHLIFKSRLQMTERRSLIWQR